MRIVIASLYLVCNLAFGESLLAETHGEWDSRIVRSDAGQQRFRALTAVKDGDSFVVLTVDRALPDCDYQYFSMNLMGTKPAKVTLTTPASTGAMRIDESPIHNITYTLDFENGDKLFTAHIVTFDGQDTLLQELVSGKVVRFKLTQDGEEYYLKFPLNGYNAAQQRTKTLCKALGGKDDKDYFNSKPQTPKPKARTDKSYFPT